MKKRYLIVAVAIAVGLSAIVYAEGRKEAPPTPAGPFVLTMVNGIVGTEPPKQDSDAMKLIREVTGVDLQVNWVPQTGYDDKINTMIAAGDMPMAMMVTQNRSPSIINAARGGVFWEIGPYLKEFPAISKLNPNVFKNTSIDGRIYQLFRRRDIGGEGFVFRKDWLNKLGLAEPKTIDDFYKVLRAFTYDDPDGNGKQDTYGLVEQAPSGGEMMRGFRIVSVWFGAPNRWGVTDGKLVPEHYTKEYMDALKFYRKLYAEKILNQDFAVINRNQKDDYINKGIGGYMISGVDQVTRYSSLTKIVPTAEMDIGSRIQGPKGVRVVAGQGYTGVFMFPKTAIKNEETLRKALGFFDKLANPRLANLFQWGFEGIHYTVKDGKAIVTAEQKTLYTRDINPLNQIKPLELSDLAFKADEPAVIAKVRSIRAEDEAIAVFNPAESIISQTFVERGNELNQMLVDSATQFIIGAIDEAGFTSAIEAWKKAGGEKVVAEYNAEWAKAGGK